MHFSNRIHRSVSNCALSVLFVGLLTGWAIPGLAQDDSAAVNIAQTAANAQNAQDYELAANQYEQLVEQFPTYSELAKVHYNAGVCYIQLDKYDQAIGHLRQAVEKLASDRAVLLPQAYLYLGFAEGRLGKLKAKDDANASQQLLNASIGHLQKLTADFPEFTDIDQAQFFLADAYESLDQLDQAITVYSNMLDQPKQAFKRDAQFALATLYERTGRLDKALEFYEEFLADGDNHVAFDEARFRVGETLTQMGLDAEKNGQGDLANELFDRAAQIYAQVAQKDGLDWADEIKFQRAFVLSRQKKYQQSAELYAEIGREPTSRFAERSMTYAGRDYFRANRDDRAIEVLEKAVAANGDHSAEAAHWLAKTYLHGQKYEKAFGIAESWIEKTDDPEIKVPLIMDAAEAAYATNTRRKSSVDIYLRIVDQYGQHGMAANALYNAAYAAMEIGEFDRAVNLVQRFENEFGSDSDYLPDALEVAGDSHLLRDDPQAAVTVFRKLVELFPDNEKSSTWALRVGLASYLNKSYQETIDWLRPRIKQFAETQARAEAEHWIGSSQFQLDQFEPAVASLVRSNQLDATWRRADETLLTLSRSYAATDQPQQASETVDRLVKQFPDSPLLAEAIYRRGESAYAKKQYQQSLSDYQRVIVDYGDSQFVPVAMYGLGWSQLKLEQFNDAAASFSALMEKYPDHELAQKALVARASSLRQGGNAEASELDAKRYMETSGGKDVDALYEIGLAQVDQKKWKDVVDTFEQLVRLAPDSKLADRFHYELAWALRSDNRPADALEHFHEIATRFPESTYAAESHFHLGQQAYDEGQYETAVDEYGDCLKADCSDALREKATYKLAWSHYKLEEYQQSLDAFRQQVKDFPEGPLHADGLFMISESLYRMKDHEGAWEAYRVARPVIEQSTAISQEIPWLTRLHGGQSANRAGKYAEAIEFLNPLLDDDSCPLSLKQDTHLELGNAYAGQKEDTLAIRNWELAAANLGKTGAHARCMIGDLHFKNEQFDEAVTQYKITYYGYGGTQAAAQVQAWQAYAAYEAARCRTVQMGQAKDQALKDQYRNEAIKHFEYLVTNYPQDRLADEASKQLKRLRPNR